MFTGPPSAPQKQKASGCRSAWSTGPMRPGRSSGISGRGTSTSGAFQREPSALTRTFAPRRFQAPSRIGAGVRCWVPASPGRPPGAQPRGAAHADERDRRQVEPDRADRQVIEQAAAQLRLGAIVAGYAGMEHKHVGVRRALAARPRREAAAGTPPPSRIGGLRTGRAARPAWPAQPGGPSRCMRASSSARLTTSPRVARTHLAARSSSSGLGVGWQSRSAAASAACTSRTGPQYG